MYLLKKKNALHTFRYIFFFYIITTVGVLYFLYYNTVVNISEGGGEIHVRHIKNI